MFRVLEGSWITLTEKGAQLGTLTKKLHYMFILVPLGRNWEKEKTKERLWKGQSL